MEKPKKTVTFNNTGDNIEIYSELIVSKLLKNHEVYSFRLENYPNTKFYIAYPKDSFWVKLRKYLCK